MSKQLQILKQELNISEILRIYGKQFKQIQFQYLMDIMAGVLWALSCRTMDGMAEMNPYPLEDH